MKRWSIAIYLALTLRCYAQTPFSVTLEPPGIANQVSPLVVNGQVYGASGVIEQTFDSLPRGNNTNVSLGTVGTYSQINVIKANIFGGAGGIGNYVSAGTSPVTLTFTTPQRYFGLWWSAGDPRNVLQFYSGNTLIQTFTTADVVSFINNLSASERAQYFGNPNPNFKAGDSGEPFAFINFFADPNNRAITFDTIVLHQADGGGFESDNHTIAASYTSITGMEIAPEPIDPVPGDIVEVGNGGTLVSDTPAEIGSGSEVIVDMGGQIKESAPIVIESGGVIVDNGTITDSAPVEIHIGGELLGEGTINAPLVDNSGMLVSTGHGLTIDGSLKEETSGVIDMATAASEIKVSGEAMLRGKLVIDFVPMAGVVRILTANSVTGEFDSINIVSRTSLSEINIYAKNGLAIAFLPFTSRASINIVTNQSIFTNIFQLLDPDASTLTALYETGFSGANTQRFKLDERFDEIRRGSTGFVSNLPPAPAPVTATGKEIALKQPVAPPFPAENRWGVWANGWGDWVSVSNDGFAKGYDFTTGGFIIGVDYRITDHFAVGLMGGYAHSAGNLQPSGDIDVNTGRGGLYATYFDHGFYINAACYGGYNSYNTSRQALLGMANGSTNSGEFSIWTETGYDFHFGDFAVGPMGALQYTLVHLDGFNETGSLLPLDIQSDHQGSLRTDFGGRASYTCHLGNVLVVPTVTVAWEHEYFYSSLPINVNSVEFPGQSATLFGPAEGHDSAIIDAGAAFQFTPRFSSYLGYQGQLGRDHYNSNAVTGGFSFSF